MTFHVFYILTQHAGNNKQFSVKRDPIILRKILSIKYDIFDGGRSSIVYFWLIIGLRQAGFLELNSNNDDYSVNNTKQKEHFIKKSAYIKSVAF